MRNLWVFILLAISSCRSNKRLNIYIENGSASQKVIPVQVYINDSLTTIVNVTQFENKISSKHVSIQLGNDKLLRIGFKIPNTSYETECVIKPADLSSKSWLHVGYGETVLPKGFNYYGKILAKDTMVERRFYCELVELPICGQIEE